MEFGEMKFYLGLIVLVGLLSGASCLDENLRSLPTEFRNTFSRDEIDLLNAIKVDTWAKKQTNPTGEEIDKGLVSVFADAMAENQQSIELMFGHVRSICHRVITKFGNDMKSVNAMFDSDSAGELKKDIGLKSASAIYSICQHILKANQEALRAQLATQIDQLDNVPIDGDLKRMATQFQTTMSEDETEILQELKTNSWARKPTNPSREEAIHAVAMHIGDRMTQPGKDYEFNLEKFESVSSKINGICHKAIDNFGNEMKIVNVLFGTRSAGPMVKDAFFRSVSAYYSICQHILKADPVNLKLELMAGLSTVFGQD